MRSSADFLAEIAHRINRDPFAVFIAEQTDCSALASVFQTHFLAHDRVFLLNDFVDQTFHFRNLFRSHFIRMREVEAEAFRIDVGSLLCHMIAEHNPQRLVQKMGRGMQTGRFRGMVCKSPFELLLRSFAGELLMLVECFLVAFQIDRKALFLCHFHGQFDREAERFIQVEGVLAADDFVLNMGGNAGDEFFEFLFSVFQCLLEHGFFAFELFQNHGFIFLEFGIGLAVVVDHDFCKALCERNRDSGLFCLADCTTDQSAEDIGLIDFSRRDAIGENKGRRTHVFDNDSFGTGPFRWCFDSTDLVEFLKERLEDFGVVAACLALEDRCDALDAHAGINVFLFHRDELSIRGLVILHEDIVPDFDPAFILWIEDFRHRHRSGPVEHFGIGSAGTGLSGGAPPVVFFREFCNAFFADPERTPEIVCLFIEGGIFITGKNREGETVNRNIQPLFSRQEFKAVLDGRFLEVVAERPVAEHFEEGEVDGIADFINISGPDAFLHVREPFPERMRGAEQKRNQRMHSGCGKQNCGIVIGNQRRALDDGVAFALIKFKKLGS